MVSLTGYIVEKQAFNVYNVYFETLTIEVDEQKSNKKKTNQIKFADLHPSTGKIEIDMKKINKGDYVTVQGKWLWHEKRGQAIVGTFEVSNMKLLKTAKTKAAQPAPIKILCSI